MIRVLSNLRALARAVSLRRDERGGVMVIGAVALFVILAMMGGGIDLGRAYMIKSRLQQACDAGSLTGRAELGRTGDWDNGPHAAADAMFNANFPAGTYGAASLVHAYTIEGETKISGTASADAPTSLMRLFGFRLIPLSVSCMGESQLSDVDVMFVLDTTTSMEDTNPGDPQSKIATLKDAVMEFYHTVEAGKAQSGRIRYGFVPYSINVNVGHLLKPEWVADHWSYPSRRALGMLMPPPAASDTKQVNFNGPLTTSGTTTSTHTVVNATSQGSEIWSCNNAVQDAGIQETVPYVNFVDDPAKPPLGPFTYPDTGGNTLPPEITSNLLPGDVYYIHYITYDAPKSGDQIWNIGFDSQTHTCDIELGHYNNFTQSYMQVVAQRPADPVKPQMYWYYGMIDYDVSGLKVVDPATGFLKPDPALALDVPAPTTVSYSGLASNATPPPVPSGTPLIAGTIQYGDPLPDPATPNSLLVGTVPARGVPFLAANGFGAWGGADGGYHAELTNVVQYLGEQRFLVRFDGAIWNGCIEERRTVAEVWDPYLPVVPLIDGIKPLPEGAYDLDIDLVPDPSRPETQWGPAMATLIWGSVGYPQLTPSVGTADPWNAYDAPWWYNSGSPTDMYGTNFRAFRSCPTEARRLSEIGEQDLHDYLYGGNGQPGLSTFEQIGTYHDIGMIWGARLLSPDGIFADDNRDPSSGRKISRNIIFMTDGVTEIEPGDYTAYGVEGLTGKRMTLPAVPASGDLTRHFDRDGLITQLRRVEEGRFQAACRAARNKGFTVWVIAFGTTLTDNLTRCATPGSALQANNAAELSQRFKAIAGSIGNLRVTH